MQGISVFNHIERLLMIFDGTFFLLSQVQFSESGINDESVLAEAAENVMKRRLSCFEFDILVDIFCKPCYNMSIRRSCDDYSRTYKKIDALSNDEYQMIEAYVDNVMEYSKRRKKDALIIGSIVTRKPEGVKHFHYYLCRRRRRRNGDFYEKNSIVFFRR